LTGNNTYTGNTTVNAGTLFITNLWFPPGNIFVLDTGTFAYQPDANDSLTVGAVAVGGSAYPWGNTTYEVDVQTDGSWVLPALNAQIVAVTGGYEIVPWTGASGGDTGELGGGTLVAGVGDVDVGGVTATLDGGGVTFDGPGTYTLGAGPSGISGNNGIWVNGNIFIVNSLTLGSTSASTNLTITITTGHIFTISGNIVEVEGSNGALTVGGNGTLVLSGNNTYTGNTTINGGTLSYTNAILPPGNIFVLGTGTFAYQPDANDSLTVSAMPTDGSAYPWGNTTYEVDVQTDGSWVLPALGVQILAVTGGYEIVPWVAPVVTSGLIVFIPSGADSSVASWDDTSASAAQRQAEANLLALNWANITAYSTGNFTALGPRR
jgi:autotransporter-associated beta strand protein